jgi:pimeloyl-ACP methyl ester carboxylesterase
MHPTGEGTAGDGTAGDGTAGDGTAGDGTAGDGTAGEGTAMVEVGGRWVCHELVGDPGGPVVVLVNGLGGQLIGWSDRLLATLRACGLATVRYDHRDAGRSSSGDQRFGFDPVVLRGEQPSAVAYRLEDLADDLVGLLDAVGVARAHLLGVSMGGMVAQLVAIRHPDRVITLTSVMSTTGARGVGQPSPAALAMLAAAAPAGPDEAVEREVANHRLLGSPGYPTGEAEVRERARRLVDRAWRPDGTARQLMAIVVAEDRTAALRRLTVPTLVVHGADDPLVDVSGGRATAAAVPGAELHVIPGMGHEIPEQLAEWLGLVVSSHAGRADARVATPTVPPLPPPVAVAAAETRGPAVQGSRGQAAGGTAARGSRGTAAGGTAVRGSRGTAAGRYEGAAEGAAGDAGHHGGGTT